MLRFDLNKVQEEFLTWCAGEWGTSVWLVRSVATVVLSVAPPPERDALQGRVAPGTEMGFVLIS